MRSSDSRCPELSTDTLPSAQPESKVTGDWAEISTCDAPPPPAGAEPESSTNPLAATDPAARVAPGDHDVGYIQHYELIRELGRGGMGVVHLARDLRLGRLVAIKMLTKPGQLQERFLAEARATARCRHENIVVIHEVGVHGEQPYLVFEYLRGQTLHQWMDARLNGAFELHDSSASFPQIPAPLAPTRAIEMIVPVVHALVCAHDMGIIHRDLKPANILLTEDGITKVLDFGVAKIGAVREDIAVEDAAVSNEPLALTVLGARLGTLPYMSPEQLAGEVVDHRSDIWAVGIILYELVTGAHPLAPLSPVKIHLMADLDTPMPSVREHRSDLGPLADIISRCLLKDKEHRTATARELLQELEALLPAQRTRAGDQESNPFAGLAAFQEADADRFFGRDHDITNLVGKLRNVPLVAVTGPLGVGKSSLVRAGVIPALKRSGEGWEAIITRPGRQPLAALAEVLLALPGRRPPGRELAHGAAEVPAERDAIITRLRPEPGHLGAELRAWARSRLRRLVLFVDQFEELYTLGADAAEQTGFMACLEAMADDAASPLRVILAVRSDFLDRMVAHRGFIAAVNRGLEFLSSLDRNGLCEALTRPMEACDHRFESPDIVERILNELEATRRPLPLLQLTARKLWTRRDRQQRMLTESSMDVLGGVGGALASHADAILAAIPAQDARLARAVFLHLVTPDRTRAHATLAKLRQLDHDAAGMDRVLTGLIEACLLAVKASAADAAGDEESDGVVEIIHESLIDRWSTLGQWLAEAPLGQSDDVECFRIAQRLYGREQEREAMLAAFARVAGGAKELLLVTGYPGIGKSALVKELAAPVARDRGYCIEGKFDQYHNVPYSALASAFGAFIHQLLTEPAERLAYWRQALRTSLGLNARVLVEVVPDLAHLIGPQPPVPRLGSTETEHRFTHAFQCYLEVACRGEHPLVMFLDDLQWADAASLRLVKLMMTDPGVSHLLIVGTYRDSEVDATHLLSVTLDQIRQNTDIKRIELQPLTIEQVCQLLADTLQRSLADCAELAALVVAKTAGNPFFVNQFLHALHQDRLLTFDGELRGWRWDLIAIQALDITDNVVELMVARMRKLPAPTQRILELAACVGNAFDIGTLSIICESNLAEIHAQLGPAIEMGLIQLLGAPGIRQHDSDEGPAAASHVFAHDRVQQAAYNLTTGDNAATHLRIARLLTRALAPVDCQQRLFELAEHFSLGAALIDEPAERLAVATMCLDAGQRAREATAYDAAWRYVETGMEQLCGDAWDEHYDLVLSLHALAADVAYCRADFERSQALIEITLVRARSPLLKARLYGLSIMQHTNQGKPQQAVQAGRLALALLDQHVPEPADAPAALAEELACIQRLLGDRPLASLLDAPAVTSEVHQATLEILATLAPATFIAAPPLFELLNTRMVRITLEHGTARHSAFGYTLYAIILAGKRDYQRAYEFAALGWALSNRMNDPAIEARVGEILVGHAHPWARPLQSADDIAVEAFHAALQSGELQYAGYLLMVRAAHHFFQGLSLQRIRDEAGSFLQFARRNKNTVVMNAVEGIRMAATYLAGATDEDGAFEMVDDAAYVERCRAEQSFFALGQYQVLKGQVLYTFGRYQDALTAVTLAEELRPYMASFFVEAPLSFYHALCLLALVTNASPAQQQAYWQALAVHRDLMKIWVQSCPENFRHMQLLIDAEVARVSGDNFAAAQRYSLAIEHAHARELLPELALAHELAARFWLASGQTRYAAAHLEDAHYAYATWGAQRKLAHLETEHAQLLVLPGPGRRVT
jgi:predicted ATPase/serine/threonine protein kinase